MTGGTGEGPPAVKRGRRASPAMTYARGLAVLWSSAGLAAGVGFAYQVLMARHLGVSDFGVFVSALATITFLTPFAACGIGLMWLQKFAREGWDGFRWVPSSLKLIALGSLVAVALYAGWILAAFQSPDQRLAAALMLPVLVGAIGVQLSEARFQLEERHGGVARWQLSKHLAILAGAGAAFLAGAGVVGTTAAVGVASLAVVALAGAAVRPMLSGAVVLKGHGPPRPAEGAVPGVAEVAGEAWPFAVTGFLYLVFFQSDLIVVSVMMESADAAIYGVAVSCISAIYFAPRIVFKKLLLARLQRMYYNDFARLKVLFARIMWVTFALSAALAVATYVVLADLIVLFFGDAYRESADILRIFALCIPFRFVMNAVGAVIVEPAHVRTSARIMAVVAAINVAGSVLLVPVLGLVGPAVTTVFVEALLALAYLVLAKRRILAAR